MNVCRLLEADLDRERAGRLPPSWTQDPTLGLCHSVDDVLRDVRRLDARSDQLLAALIDRGLSDKRAVSVVIVALLPLVLARCTGGRTQVDELIGELAIVIAEAAAGELAPSGRRVANRLVDRAWGRVRLPARRVCRPLPIDPIEMDLRAGRGLDPADVAALRVDLERSVRWLSVAGPAYGATVRAWNTAVDLVDADSRTPSELSRLKHARRVLRRSRVADLVA
jgi:hypothetical protein